MISATLEASNKTDWTVQITALDEDTGDEIDFTGASVAFFVKDENGCTRLQATTSDLITISTTLIEVSFPVSGYMNTLCAGVYSIGCIYDINNETTQLLTGIVSVYDGIAKL